uniref:AP2/ERF domain-containing protein n=1 Tax=Auxenochlorella protothecoides TaxID=3075 RepID=A0A1D1ZV60_AUXPR
MYNVEQWDDPSTLFDAEFAAAFEALSPHDGAMLAQFKDPLLSPGLVADRKSVTCPTELVPTGSLDLSRLCLATDRDSQAAGHQQLPPTLRITSPVVAQSDPAWGGAAMHPISFSSLALPSLAPQDALFFDAALESGGELIDFGNLSYLPSEEDLRVHVFDPVRSPRPRTLPAPPPPVPVLSLHLVPPPPRLPPLQRPFPGGRLEDGAALGSPKRGRGGESSESEPSPKRWPSSASGYFTDDSPSPRSTVSRAQAQGDPAPGTGARSRLATQPAAAPGQGEQAGAPPGGRTSAYRGVSRHRLTQRWEASLWLNGRQLYLGGFNGQEEAAAAYDLAALACKGLGAMTNHPPEEYTEQLAEIAGLTRDEVVAYVRRRSSAFSRGKSKYRGVSGHNGRWEARIGSFGGRKNVSFGIFESEDEAARQYDRALILEKGRSAKTNFPLQDYEREVAQHEAYLQSMPPSSVPTSQRSFKSGRDTSPEDRRRSAAINGDALRRSLRLS